VPAETSGLICAGWQTHVHLVCRPERDLPTVEALVDWLEAMSMEPLTEPPSESPEGRTLWIDRQGLRLEPEAVDWNRPILELVPTDDGPAVDERPGVGDGVADWRCRYQLVSPLRAAVIGAGHCGRALAASLARCGWQALLFDPRESVVREAEQILSDDPAGRRVRVVKVDDPESAGERIPFPEMTSVVVMTTDLGQDVRALLGTLPRPFPFVGVMGSEAKLAEIRRRLEAAGLDDGTLARLVAPVGLPIASRTPEEIAVSVTGQLLACQNVRADSEVGPENSFFSPIALAPREVSAR
jgi:xanthine dehydrogenase accessory factor